MQLPVKLIIESEFEPVQTACIIEIANHKCRMFRGYKDRKDFTFDLDTEWGVIHVRLIKKALEHRLILTYDHNTKQKPELRVVK